LSVNGLILCRSTEDYDKCIPIVRATWQMRCNKGKSNGYRIGMADEESNSQGLGTVYRDMHVSN